MLGLRGYKLLLNGFQLARTQRARMGRPFDREGDQLIALALKDFDRIAKVLARKSDCGAG